MLGQILEDRYLVEAELGEGAMGRVYRARHIKVGRQVAIKVMHSELARVPTIVERFAREARIAARLHHPNVVGVLDVGTTPDKKPMIVLELAPGKSLFDLLTGPMEAQRVVRIIRQLLLGLDHAHAAGLVHRDLKPDNILVETRADGAEIPRIVDFGIAVCKTGDDEIANQRLTDVNTVIGTPCYMSPEQAMAKELDARTDLFSLGVIMYELLAGMPPFAGSGVDVAVANASKDAPSIKERAGIDVDSLLEAFARKLMARRVGDRFQSAREALVMLDQIESDRIAAARSLSRGSAPVAPVAMQATPPVCLTFPMADLCVVSEDDDVPHPVTGITRVEQIARRRFRPSRRRALQAIGMMAAVLTLAVGWRAADRDVATSASLVAAKPALSVPVLVPSPAPVAAIRVSEPVSQIRVTTAEPAAAAMTASVVSAPARPAAKRTSPVRSTKAAPAQRTIIAAATPAVAPAQVTHTTIVDTADAVAARYVAVGKALRGAPDTLWARYRHIRINDALKTEQSRRAALVALTDIERAINR